MGEALSSFTLDSQWRMIPWEGEAGPDTEISLAECEGQGLVMQASKGPHKTIPSLLELDQFA